MPVKFDPQARLRFEIAQLRHAYAQLNAGAVKDYKQFANGLIAPVIEDLEKVADRMETIE